MFVVTFDVGVFVLSWCLFVVAFNGVVLLLCMFVWDYFSCSLLCVIFWSLLRINFVCCYIWSLFVEFKACLLMCRSHLCGLHIHRVFTITTQPLFPLKSYLCSLEAALS